MTVEELLKPRYKVIAEAPKYEIGDDGCIRNIKTGRILKAAINNRGYKYYELQTKEGQKRFYSARLVAIYFVENSNNLPVVNHKDGNKLNNNFSNLEWVSYKDNSQHAFKTGLGKSGFEHYSSRFCHEDYWEIKELNKKGLKNFEIARLYNVSETAIRNIVIEASYKHIIAHEFNLINPRFRVKIKYPFSSFKVGDIVTTGKNSYLYRIMSEFREVFAPIEWWEERKPEEMPEYVKGENENYSGVFKVTNWKLDDGLPRVFVDKMPYTFGISQIEAATKEEYENYIKSK